MKLTNRAIIWDAENDRILCRFRDYEEVIAAKEAEEVEEEINLEELKVAELKEIAEEKGLNHKELKKDELIVLLKGAE